MKVKLYNKIAKQGLDLFSDAYEYENVEEEDAILVRSASLHDLEFSSNLKAIARAGAGTNNIPIDRCSEAGIVVFNTPGANANAVKELVFAGMLMSARPILQGVEWLKQQPKEGINERVEKEKSKFKGNELKGKTLGVIGLGAIGLQVANTALHFGMKVYGYDPFISVQSAWQLSKHVLLTKEIDELYQNCDYISIHVPLNKDTKHMIHKDVINKMKDQVCVLNFARGGLVDALAMKEALQQGKVKTYVCDFPQEELVGLDQVISIPHLGASTDESEENCAVMAVNELMEYLENGNIKNSVNMPECSMERNGNLRIACIHHNVPNMLAQISKCVSNYHINIINMLNKSKGAYAYTMIDIENQEIDCVVDALKQIDAVLKVQIYKD